MARPTVASHDTLPRLREAATAFLGRPLSQAELDRFVLYRDLLLDWNRGVNLTSVTDPTEVETRHFADSLSVASAPEARLDTPVRVIDVGSGAGFPGLPLNIAYPVMALTLLESTGKKAAFLRHVVERLGLNGVSVVWGRAEDIAHREAHREAYDLVLARAVAPMAALAELTLPFCRLGGHLVAQKQGDIGPELAGAAPALEALGGRLKRRIEVSAPGLDRVRELVVVEKVASTPPRYPRRPGMPAKRPIGS